MPGNERGMMNATADCPKCLTESATGAKFCAACGWDLARDYRETRIAPKQLGLFVVLTLAIWLGGWQAQQYLAGKQPSAPFEAQGGEHKSAEISDPELQKLRAAAEADPKNKDGWNTLANAIAQKLQSSEQADPALVFEAIAALRHILDIDPKDANALLAMAEISFNQQAFSKAADFYKQFLELEPADLDIRARYGSTLTFVGQFDDSLKQLNQVLARNPRHFHALAYLSVTYAEMGKQAEALATGERAIAEAPSDEARARFSEFMTTVKEGPKKQEMPTAVRGNVAPPTALPPEGAAIAEQMKSNSVAGRKFAGAEMRDGTTLVLNFNDFPMEQMPPFVREKFTNGVKEQLAKGSGTVKTVIFYDKQQQRELTTVTR